MTQFVTEPAPDFGPEFTATPLDPAMPAPEPAQTTRAKNKAAGEESKGIFGSLGKNSPARSNVRRLTDDDARKLAARYDWVAGMVKYVHPRLARSIDDNTEVCVQSWMNLAENNVKVRAKILAFIEGGEIMGVVIAHSPLLIAALPEKYVAMFMQGIMSGFGKFANEPEEPEEDPAFYPGEGTVTPPFQRVG